MSIDLTEPGYTPENEIPRVPNQEIPKDPTVVNTGNNDEIVFVSFDIPMKTVKTAEYDGTVQAEACLLYTSGVLFGMHVFGIMLDMPEVRKD